MGLVNLKVADVVESKTNPRGTKFEDNDFQDLLKSVEEKGVMVPILARLISGGKFEVIAGARRFRAAKMLKMEFIPANVVEMDDEEAMEAQIIENLQRADIHPIDEGEAYRKLMATGKQEIVTIAAHVGKSESYVKQRLFLTNLEQKPKDAYRSGKINDGHAVMIAKLSAKDQEAALKATLDRYNTMNVKELKEWIEAHIYNNLDNQPWLTMGGGQNAAELKELNDEIGKCQECKPERMSLFGPVKEGACTDLKCWKRKMDNYINLVAKEQKRTKISSEYGKPPAGIKFGQGDYVLIAKKGKDRCGSVHGAVVAHGSNIGQLLDICSDKNCKIHEHGQSEYKRTPAEEAKLKAERKKEKEKELKSKQDRDKRLTDALAKVKFPLSEKHLDVLLGLAMEMAGSNLERVVAKRHELEAKKEKNSWGSTSIDYRGAVKEFIKGLDNNGKIRMVFELMIDTGYNQLREGVGKL